MLTFTVPEALRPFLRAHQRDGYSALFAASSAAIKTLARNPRHSSRRKLHTNLHHPIVIARRATRQRRAPWQPRDASPANQATSLNCHVATLLATTNQWVTRLVHREAQSNAGNRTRTLNHPIVIASAAKQTSALALALLRGHKKPGSVPGLPRRYAPRNDESMGYAMGS